MKKISTLFCATIFSCTTMTYAGNKCEVIIPGDHSPKSFRTSSKVKEGDYLPNTVIFKVKSQYRQNCKVNSVDNILPIQDYLQNVGAQDVAKLFPHHQSPLQERNALGKKNVDLTTIYSCRYSSSLSLDKVINDMLSLGYFEYVEPWYVPKTLAAYTPNDVNTNQY